LQALNADALLIFSFLPISAWLNPACRSRRVWFSVFIGSGTPETCLQSEPCTNASV
jgi:hypothetical protein